MLGPFGDHSPTLITTLSAFIVTSPKMVPSPLDAGDITKKPITAFKRTKRIHRKILPLFDLFWIIKFINRQEIHFLSVFFAKSKGIKAFLLRQLLPCNNLKSSPISHINNLTFFKLTPTVMQKVFTSRFTFNTK
jgi:hypothetical protein